MGLLATERFPRGSGPLVSVLIPTRERPDGLRKTIESVWSLCHRKDLLEFILKIDQDDRKGLEAVSYLVKQGYPIRTVISSKGRGYRDLHLWIDDMAQKAGGDWLFVLSDDAIILSEGWDEILYKCQLNGVEVGRKDGIYLLCPGVAQRPGSYEFFIIRKEVYQVLGRLSPTPHADTWLTSLLNFIQRMSVCSKSIVISHPNSRPNSIDTLEELCSVRLLKEKVSDATKLIDYIERKQNVNK